MSAFYCHQHLGCALKECECCVRMVKNLLSFKWKMCRYYSDRLAKKRYMPGSIQCQKVYNVSSFLLFMSFANNTSTGRPMHRIHYYWLKRNRNTMRNTKTYKIERQSYQLCTPPPSRLLSFSVHVFCHRSSLES